MFHFTDTFHCQNVKRQKKVSHFPVFPSLCGGKKDNKNYSGKCNNNVFICLC